MISFIKYFLMFLLIIFLQVFVLDQIQPGLDYIRPELFFVFLIALPALPGVWSMIIGFGVGLVFDILYGTPGINSAACVLIGYIKDPLIRAFKNEEGSEEVSAHIVYLGFARFLFYVLIISLVYHLIAGFLNVFSFQQSGQTLLRILINTGISAILVYIYEIIFFYRKVTAK